jgi:hypothetical protein
MPTRGSLSGNSAAFADKIITIAGIIPGNRVLCLGAPDTAVETAVACTGARLLKAIDSVDSVHRIGWPITRKIRADVILYALAVYRESATARSLATIRRLLRPSGRLVVWAATDRCGGVNSLFTSLQQQILSAGFTSIIVGPVQTALGEVAVATAVAGSLHSAVDKRKRYQGDGLDGLSF